MSDTKEFLPVTERNTHAIIEQIRNDRDRMDGYDVTIAAQEQQIRNLTMQVTELSSQVLVLTARVEQWQ